MTKNLKMVCKIWMIRSAVNVVVGTIISLFIYRSQQESFFYSYLIALIITFSVSTSAFIVSDAARFIIVPVFTKLRFAIYVSIILMASAAGAFAGALISNTVLPGSVRISGDIFPGIVIPSIMISSIFIAIYFSMGKARLRQATLENDLIRYKQEKEKSQRGSIPVKEDDLVRSLDYKDIVYLSSNGRVSLIHTVGRDYQVNQLLGDMEKSLPGENFIRIHKQFIVNRRFIKGIRYYEGGRYNLYLSDEDENVLPIGKLYTSDVKKIMNI